jgi:hypothetical protein
MGACWFSEVSGPGQLGQKHQDGFPFTTSNCVIEVIDFVRRKALFRKGLPLGFSYVPW